MAMRGRGLQSSAERPKEITGYTVNENIMKLTWRWVSHRRVLVALFLSLGMIFLSLLQTRPEQPVERHVSPAHKQLVHKYVHSVLEGQCRPRDSREKLLAHFLSSSEAIHPFLWNDEQLSDDLFLHPPPFGFKGLNVKVQELLKLLPAPDSGTLPENVSGKCQRCVVIGNGGILKGLELGQLIDRFDTIIRLNSGPLGEFSTDVGNRTSIRMSYPEGTPLHWADTDPHVVFVAVVYKTVDLSWISAMIKKLRVNVPTLGVSALNLASLLCDEVSLVGFGYNLSQQGVPLHYYDHLPMTVMQQQKMHNVGKETQLLHKLVKEGVITDLTGGIHCSFCPS
ncbi:lactosylceramide alpha-2,3-sialyltransferase isoform X3 [Girardinichthys multiradiatus]|uniref:lactosylceramide alpha-2,3-sialyltransferase isoform X3 n=1 Tax=Girardinichthys multiradiatus TaxID=208333 RepID=UPI001FAC7052|nr:lactosylceramide alpha-2,3-sialyltransferase isoform X3 [Girardinichthys multiradiatus]